MKKVLLKSVLVFSLSVGTAAASSLIADDKVKVTADELALAITSILPEATQQGMRDDEKNIRLFLIDYFTSKQIGEAAREEGLDDAAAFKIKQDYAVNRLLTDALLEKRSQSVKPANYEALAKEAYLANSKHFAIPEQVEAEHILIAVNAQQDEATALAKANDLYAQVKKNPSAFAELAQQHSDDPSAKDNAGRLGFFTRDSMVKPFADAAFSMKKGQVSKPVQSQFGYHIIHVLDRKEAGKQPFAEVKERLMAEQRSKHESAKRFEVVDSFQGRDSIVIDDAAFAEFVKAFQQKTSQ